MKRTLATLAFTVLAFATARAADVETPVSYGSPFEGPYIGAFAGAGSASFDGIIDNSELPGDPEFTEVFSGLDDTDLAFGGYLGYNWLSDSILLGLEADFSVLGSGVRTRESGDPTRDFADLDAEWIASLRGRLGVTQGNVLLYGTGGVALLGAELHAFNDQTGGGTPEDGSKDFTSLGFVAGVGAEWAVTDNAAIRIEGLYFAFDDKKKLSEDELHSDVDDGDFAEVKDVIMGRIGFTLNF